MTADKTASDVAKVESKLKYWSQQLHDLSGRNRLLFYRDTRSSTATIEHPDFFRLFEVLVEKGSDLLVPIPAPGEVEDSVPDPEEIIVEELGLEAIVPDDVGLAEVVEGRLPQAESDAEQVEQPLPPEALHEASMQPNRERKSQAKTDVDPISRP